MTTSNPTQLRDTAPDQGPAADSNRPQTGAQA